MPQAHLSVYLQTLLTNVGNRFLMKVRLGIASSSSHPSDSPAPILFVQVVPIAPAGNRIGTRKIKFASVS